MIYRFDDTIIDTDALTVHCDGELRAVEPLTFDLIVYLIEHRERVISRQELFDALWAGRVVGDATLSNHINAARSLIGDDGERQQMIKTRRGRGYQFIATLREPTRVRRRLSPRTLRFGTAGVVAAVVLGLTIALGGSERVAPTGKEYDSIAVLPLVNRSERPEDDYFTAGVHDDLLTQVSKIRGVKTISRTSVMQYESTGKTSRTIADELGVTTLLEGGIQRVDDQIRVNVQLIDAKNDSHLWAETFTRELNAENIFEIQSEIALKVARSLSTVFTPDQAQRLNRVPTQNLRALKAWFRGLEARKRGSEGLLEAPQHFKKAIDLDPAFADAHVQLAQTYVEQIWYNGYPRDRQIPLAEPLLERAMALDPGASQAHVVLSQIRRQQDRIDESEAQLWRAIELNPNNADAWYHLSVIKLWALGDHTEALAYSRRALELDPNSSARANMLAESLLATGQFQRALDTVESAIDEEPSVSRLHRTLGEIYSWGFHRDDFAIKAYRQGLAVDPGSIPLRRWLTLSYARLGDNQRANYWLEQTLELSPSGTIHHPEDRGKVAYIQGDRDTAIALWRSSENQPNFIANELYQVGKWEVRRGRVDKALALYRNRVPGLTDTRAVDSSLFASLPAYIELLQISGDEREAQRQIQRADDFLVGEGSVLDWFYQSHLLYLAVTGREESLLEALHEHYDKGHYFNFTDAPHSDVRLVTVREYLSHRESFRRLLEKFDRRRKWQLENVYEWERQGELAELPEAHAVR